MYWKFSLARVWIVICKHLIQSRLKWWKDFSIHVAYFFILFKEIKRNSPKLRDVRYYGVTIGRLNQVEWSRKIKEMKQNTKMIFDCKHDEPNKKFVIFETPRWSFWDSVHTVLLLLLMHHTLLLYWSHKWWQSELAICVKY